MSKYHVSITKVFGAAVTDTITVEAENKYEAKEKALDANWESVYNAITQNNMSDAYEIAEVTVNGETIVSTDFNDHLLDEAIRINKGTE